jgi:23S rRNA pseudouridine1911/1915/1917 synthase
MDTKSLVPEVLYEDANVIALNKPAGLLVHGIFTKDGPKHTEETLVDWLAKKYPETQEVGDRSEEGLIRQQRGGIVHRLDRDTSGVMIVARTQKSFEYLKRLFETKNIMKQYVALVWGRIHEKSGVIDKPISIKDGSVKRTVFKGKMPREAVTEYERVSYFQHRHGKHIDELTLLSVSPKTGRTHQIRVHLSSIGHAVAGDKMYGKKGVLAFEDGTELNRHFLHAQKLTFSPRAGAEKITIEAPLPAELTAALANLTPIE